MKNNTKRENDVKFDLHGITYNINLDDNKDICTFEGYLPWFMEGQWEANTFEIFNHVKNPNKNAIDIGAWIGTTTIWLSKNFKEVLAIDADKISTKALESNLKNSECFNTYVLNSPIHSTNTEVVFGVNQYVQLYQSQGLGNSTSQIKDGGFTESDYKLKTTTLDQLNQIFPFSDVSFVKVDIEGGEEHILSDIIKLAEEYHWDLWISFHFDWWKDKNIDRFQNLFNNAIDIRFESLQNKITDPKEVINLIKTHPFSSIYFKF
jgi:FkbM family methyltransferase